MKKQLFLVAIALLTGCASLGGGNSMPDRESRSELVKDFPELTDAQRAQFIAGNVWIGMNETQFSALYGDPAKEQVKLTSIGQEKINLYAVRVGNWKTGIVTKYYRANFVNDRLTSFQELDRAVGSLDKL